MAEKKTFVIPLCKTTKSGHNVVVRRYNLGDAHVLPSILTWNVCRFLSNAIPYPYTFKDAEYWIDLHLRLYEGEDSGKIPLKQFDQMSYAIEVDGEMVGSIGYRRLTDIREKTMEVGYYIKDGLWGRGIASVALELLVNYIHERHPEIIRVQAFAYLDNTASHRVLEKNGFIREGVSRRSCWKKGPGKNEGTIYDDVLYALVRTD